MLRTCALAAGIAWLAAAEPATATAPLDATALAQRSPLIAALAPAEGAWTEVVLKPVDRSQDVARITAAGIRYIASLKAAKDAPSEPAQRAIATFIKKLASDEKPMRPDELDPVFVRRAVRGGALRQLGADAAVTAEIEKAVVESAKTQPTAAFTGPKGARLEERLDAFGIGGWTMSGSRSAYAVGHSEPLFLPMRDLALVVELPSGTDPASGPAKAVSAALVHEKTTIATWTARTDRLESDLATWRDAVPEPVGRGLARGLLPPHLVLAGLDGDPVRLATLHGSVVPARDGKPAEYERVLTEVAKAMPDAANLDLFGQHLFRYVFDSPDPRFPLVIGNTEIKGEVHQTAAQTLAATTGGQCRGDCDDLAELYQTLAEKQGRFGHLLILPSHTAFASARKDGSDWVIEVMQTGPTYAFRAPTAAEALRNAHAHFDSTAPFSPDQLGLLLRFSGENTRGPFRLGWRIFTEREYARTMIDVQRDWQYQTYARAIAKMEKLIAAGDKDPANYSEIAGLYRATGQWAKAAELYRQTLAGVSDPVSTIDISMDLASALRQSGKPDEAVKVLTDLSASLKDLAPKLGDGIAQVGIRLSLAMLTAGDKEGSRKVLMQTAFGPLGMLTQRLAQMVSQPGFERSSWSGDGRLAGIRQLIGRYIGCLVTHIEHAGPEAAKKDPALAGARQIVDLWLAKLAFLEADSPADAVPLYAFVSRIHALDSSTDALAKDVAAAKPPTDARFDHLKRPLGPAALARQSDLSWIRICPTWWQGETDRAMHGGHDIDDGEDDDVVRIDPAKADRVRMAEAAKGASAARAACAKLGFADQRLDQAEHFALLTSAIANGDDKVLRERLRHVKLENDKRLRDATAGTIGRLAPLCDEKQWQAVLKAWADEVDYKPKWFMIAWMAAVTGSPKNALATARMAAARFKDEPSFAEEAAFMEKLLAGK